jgi:phosphatidate phosphatase APP1
MRQRIQRVENRWDSLRLKAKAKLNLFDEVIIYPYRGFGNEQRATLTGRVLERESVIHKKDELNAGVLRNIWRVYKRYESDELPGVKISGTFAGVTSQCTSDDEGYFQLEFDIKKDLSEGWHDVKLEVMSMPFDIPFCPETTGEILIAHNKPGLAIISDVDDTIIKSHATNALNKVITLLRYDAHDRTPFENVEELYRHLVDGGRNPLFFVSGSSYNLYDLLTDFSEHHQIPKAPFLLRDLGLTAEQWLKQDTSPYKLEHIKTIVSRYDKKSFVLIGDSGQLDPEIYAQVQKDYPGRVVAIYIRDLGNPKRQKEIEEMNKELEVKIVLADDSMKVLKHFQKQQFVPL